MDLWDILLFGSNFFVARPERIAAIAIMFLVAFLILSQISNYKSWPFLVTTGFWGVFALWEWLILIYSPEANIRIDLLLIYPLLLGVTIWSIFWILFRR